MSKYSKGDIMRTVEDEDVEFIRLQFTDIFEMLKSAAIIAGQLEKALDNRCMFDDSTIKGFVRINGSDMYLYPDLDTFEVFPWRPQQDKVARFIHDVHNSDGTPFSGDPRYVLKRAVRRAQDIEYVLNMGPECEFLLFHTGEEGGSTASTHEMTGYFDVSPTDLAEDARRDTVLNLEEMGFWVEASHHKVAPAQHEIDFQYTDALRTTNNTMTFEMTAKTIAGRHGLHATFTPESREGMDGSSMHIDMSLLDKKGRSLFTDDQDTLRLDRGAYYSMAGILRHMKAMIILTNPLVNSCKRSTPGLDTLIYIAWSPTLNRSSLIRIPSPKRESTWIELRCLDSAMNPYLALAAYLSTGLDGIEEKTGLPACAEGNMFTMESEEPRERNVERIPEALGDATEAYNGDSSMKEVLGEHIYTKYLKTREQGWQDFRAQITDWEVSQYLCKY